MKFIGINGSPRKGWNTSTLVERALEGARSEGAEVEMIDLYDLNYQGCESCYECKRKGVTVETCVKCDGLKPLLKKITTCDGLILGSPIYMGNISGEMQSFVERLTFPYLSFDDKPATFPKSLSTAFIYTMNVFPPMIKNYGYDKMFDYHANIFKIIFTDFKNMYSTGTCQFEDYDKYAASTLSGEERLQRREIIFPQDCEKAYYMGADMVKSMR